MYIQSGQTTIKRLIAFRDKAPIADIESRKTVTLEELMPGWWGTSRALTGQDS